MTEIINFFTRIGKVNLFFLLIIVGVCLVVFLGELVVSCFFKLIKWLREKF